jgi:transcriptional regulator with XRE-family HTH domain
MVQAHRDISIKRYRQPGKRTVETCATIGEAIRLRRKEYGYTQVELAKRMGISPRLLGEIEHGKTTVAIGTVLNICQNIGIDLVVSVRGTNSDSE